MRGSGFNQPNSLEDVAEHSPARVAGVANQPQPIPLRETLDRLANTLHQGWEKLQGQVFVGRLDGAEGDRVRQEAKLAHQLGPPPRRTNVAILQRAQVFDLALRGSET